MRRSGGVGASSTSLKRYIFFILSFKHLCILQSFIFKLLFQFFKQYLNIPEKEEKEERWRRCFFDLPGEIQTFLNYYFNIGPTPFFTLSLPVMVKIA